MGLCVVKLKMNWLKIGWMLADRGALILVTLVIVLVIWRKYMLPNIEGTLAEADKTIKTIAGLGGIKRADYEETGKLEQAIGSKIVASKMPELQALKLLVGSETAEDIDNFIENNPTAAMQLYEKYRHFLPGAQASQEKTDF